MEMKNLRRSMKKSKEELAREHQAIIESDEYEAGRSAEAKMLDGLSAYNSFCAGHSYGVDAGREQAINEDSIDKLLMSILNNCQKVDCSPAVGKTYAGKSEVIDYEKVVQLVNEHFWDLLA